ncbi:MAG: hypothetical protein ACI9R3_005208 [Verrucomicrobiales bacterium]|jgi:hypothetical protein
MSPESNFSYQASNLYAQRLHLMKNQTVKTAILPILCLSTLLIAGETQAAVFTVVNTNDSGPGSFHEAISEANVNAGPDTVAFNIPGAGPHRIQQITLLEVTDPVVIDGYTQPGASPNTLTLGNNAVLMIELDGSLAGPDAIGLYISAGQSTVRGLCINRFPDTGILLDVGNGNVVAGNFLGTDVTGTIARGNGHAGCEAGSDGNRIGGTAPADRNLVSGNVVGVQIDPGVNGISRDNVIQGNFVGTDASGTQALPNTEYGIFNIGSQDGFEVIGTLIGGSTPGAGNLVSGNRMAGAEVWHTGAAFGIYSVSRGGLVIQGNRIGTDVTGEVKLGNQSGVMVGGNEPLTGAGSAIGGTGSGEGNLISGNEFSGLRLSGSSKVVQGNLIGTDVTGTEPLGNGQEGIVLSQSDVIGGTTPGARNIISCNGGYGGIIGVGPGNFIVQGNFIGTDITGTRALNQQAIGIALYLTSNALVGGTTPGARNVISGNTTLGVDIRSSETKLQGNYIGTDVTGTVALGNRVGVYLADDSLDNLIGGVEPGAGNVISGNEDLAIQINGSGVARTRVQGNLMGTDKTGTLPLANGSGIEIHNSSNNIIGGPETGAANTIAHCQSSGVAVTVQGVLQVARNNTIRGNSIYDTGLDQPALVGIDLSPGGITPNDGLDADTGSNNLQNFPTVTAATALSGGTLVMGSFGSKPGQIFTLDFYSNADLDPTGYGEGETYLGTTTVTTSATTGNASFSVTLPVDVVPGRWVTATATDFEGNTSEFSAARIVIDGVAPVIGGVPANVVTTTDAALPTAAVNWTAPTASDNLAVTSFTGTHAPGNAFPVGVTTVTYTARDAAGNETSASFTVTVSDPEAPVINGIPADISGGTDTAVATAAVSWTPPAASDNVAVVTFVSTHPSGTVFALGVTTVTYTATDAAGNSTSASFSVMISDLEGPVFSGVPANIQMGTAPGLATAAVSWGEPVATDNVLLAEVTGSHAPGVTFALGSTVVTYTARDAVGNATSVSFSVTVVDAEAPVITGTPANITLPTELGKATAVATWTPPSASDNVGVVTFTGSHTSGTAFPVGVTTVSYTATDAAGNATTAAFTVTVADQETPLITGVPTDIDQLTDAGKPTAVVTWTEPSASDNVGVTLFSPTHTSGSEFSLGATTVIYTARDAAGNEKTASFTVTIRDAEAPIISGLSANIMQATDAGKATAVVNWSAPTITDNVGVTATGSTQSPGATFPLGDTIVSYTASDAAGNETSGSFTVTVEDREAPVISGLPISMTMLTDEGKATAVAEWVEPTATDNVAVDSFAPSHPSGAALPIGITVVIYTARDAAGNEITATFNITVTDGEPPVIASVPLDIVVLTDAGKATAVVNWTAPTATDNVGVTSLSSTHAPGAVFPVGATEVTYTAIDAAGNEALASFTVTVADGEKPVIAGMPAEVSLVTIAGQTSAVATWTEPSASDNVGVTSFVGSPVSGSEFPVGTTTVTYTASDAAGNEASASFLVTVNEPVETGGFSDWLAAGGYPATTDPSADANHEGFPNVFHYLWDVPLDSLIAADPRGLVPMVDRKPNSAAFVFKVPRTLPPGVTVVIEASEDGQSWTPLARRSTGQETWEFEAPVTLEASPPVGGLETVNVGSGKTYAEASAGLFRLQVVLDAE